MRRFIALILVHCVCGLASQASAAVVITFDDTRAQVSNGPDFGSSDSDIQQNTGGTIAVATLPGYSSTTTSLFSSASMPATFVQSRLGDVLGYAYGEATANFTTDVDVPYSASGSFSNSAGYSRYYAQLYDYTTGTYPFLSDQESNGPAIFTLGGANGNVQNVFVGSLTGTLLAGHEYQWYAEAGTQRLVSADGGATAGGDASLAIGTAAVPEASSVFVWSLLGLTIGGICWWKRGKFDCASDR